MRIRRVAARGRPYVHSNRGRTFVVAFEGELIETGHLNALVHDLSLLHALGIRLVLGCTDPDAGAGAVAAQRACRPRFPVGCGSPMRRRLAA